MAERRAGSRGRRWRVRATRGRAVRAGSGCAGWLAVRLVRAWLVRARAVPGSKIELHYTTMWCIKHKNKVGNCTKGIYKMLVYEYMDNENLKL
ncbi:hypothetical protein AgCh_012600 [Apium graveolens]